MKKKVLLLMACFTALILVLAACGNDDDETAGNNNEPTNNAGTDNGGNGGGETGGNDGLPDGMYVDEHGNYRFTETRHISVALWNRLDEVETSDTDWAHWIQEQMLEVHNISVEFETTTRWGEGGVHSVRLSAGTAPDVGYTQDMNMVRTLGTMGGMINLYPWLQQYGHMFPHMYDLATEEYIYWELDPVAEELWAITGRRTNLGIPHLATFIREDWLNALDLPIPTTLEEYEATLKAFRDRADELPGVGNDVTWRVITQHADEEADLEEEYEYRQLTISPEDIIPKYVVGLQRTTGVYDAFIPHNISERERFMTSFGYLANEHAAREMMRVFNRWFNEGLIYQDFVLAESVNEGDMVRLGLVGSINQMWDQPFRPADGWTRVMRENIGVDANWIAIFPFENDAGVNRKFTGGLNDRSIFFPNTNTEVMASLLYLDFMSRPETLDFLQFGFEGVHHEILDGGLFGVLPSQYWPPEQNMSGARNFDIIPLINGVWFDLVDQDRAFRTAALAYPGIAPESIIDTLDIIMENTYIFRPVNVRAIDAEEGRLGPLQDLAFQMFDRLVASPDVNQDNFDAMFDAEYANFLATGARAIMAEREQAWIEMFGDVDNMPGR